MDSDSELRIDDDFADASVILGRGLQINKDLHVRGNGIFNTPIQTPDVLIAQPPGGGVHAVPESLLKRIERLEAEVKAIKAKLGTL